MRNLEEELPEIMVEFSDAIKGIRVHLMEEIQTEVIQQLVLDQ